MHFGPLVLHRLPGIVRVGVQGLIGPASPSRSFMSASSSAFGRPMGPAVLSPWDPGDNEAYLLYMNAVGAGFADVEGLDDPAPLARVLTEVLDVDL